MLKNQYPAMMNSMTATIRARTIPSHARIYTALSLARLSE